MKRIDDDHVVIIPLHGLHEEPMNNHSVLKARNETIQSFFLFPQSCTIIVLLLPIYVQWLVVEAQLINRKIVLPGIVLESSRQESLREEEP